MNEPEITIRGWVGSDVLLTEVGGGVHVASFRVGSTPRRLRNGVWEDGPTLWFTVKAWRGLAERVAESVQVRQPVVVHGRLVADVWEKDDGSTSVKYVVVATTVGHDLSHGTSTFTRAERRAMAEPDESPLREVIHSYDESGPRLTSSGDVVEQPAPVGATGEESAA